MISFTVDSFSVKIFLYKKAAIIGKIIKVKYGCTSKDIFANNAIYNQSILSNLLFKYNSIEASIIQCPHNVICAKVLFNIIGDIMKNIEQITFNNLSDPNIFLRILIEKNACKIKHNKTHIPKN